MPGNFLHCSFNHLNMHLRILVALQMGTIRIGTHINEYTEMSANISMSKGLSDQRSLLGRSLFVMKIISSSPKMGLQKSA